VIRPRSRWVATATWGGTLQHMRPKANQTAEQEDDSTAEINIRHGVQRRHLQQPRTRKKDQQDEFGDQPPPKDHRKLIYVTEILLASGKPGDGVRSAVALWESGRVNRTRRPGCGDRGEHMLELLSELKMVVEELTGTDGK